MADEVALVQQMAKAKELLLREIHKTIVGQETVIEQIVIALFCRGHVLLVGVPGLAKTLLVKTLAQALALTFNRIQFTPDLMPSDITGTDILEEDQASKQRIFRFVKGPIFAHLLLADEINRTPPKTQAALLEAMQEQQVTAGGQRYELPQPFLVMATQNPIEQEGTYPLPEAQLDRFLFNIRLDYPAEEEERQIVHATTADRNEKVRPVLNAEQILRLQRVVWQIPLPETALAYAVRLTRLTRPTCREATALVRECVSWGAGPRAAQHLVLAAKARAALHGRFAVDIADIKAVALPVLRHRIVTNFNADAEGVTSDAIVKQLLKDLK